MNRNGEASERKAIAVVQFFRFISLFVSCWSSTLICLFENEIFVVSFSCCGLETESNFGHCFSRKLSEEICDFEMTPGLHLRSNKDIMKQHFQLPPLLLVCDTNSKRIPASRLHRQEGFQAFALWIPHPPHFYLPANCPLFKRRY